MNKYNQGKIYKIVDNTNGNIYFGSTTQKLETRLKQHKLLKYSSRDIIKNGNYDIVLIENYPSNSRKELESREGYFIRNNDCVNNIIVSRTPDEYYQEHKEQIRIQRIDYRKRTKEKAKVYDKNRKQYKKSWGGDARYDNNLLMIDTEIFLST